MDILSHEPLIRLASFAGVLLLMIAWEWLAPRRGRDSTRPGLQLTPPNRWHITAGSGRALPWIPHRWL